MASCSGTSREYTLTLNVNQVSQNVAENYSDVSWSLVFNCGQYYYQNGSTTDNFQAWINGVCVYNANRAISFPGQYKSITIASNTYRIYHEGDGTKTAGISCSFSPGKTANYYPGAFSGSGNIGLSTIPRATTPNVNNYEPILGTTITISTPRASGSFTHTLEWWCGSLSGTIATNVATSTTWVVPLTIATQYPNSVTGAVGIRCHTYSGGTLLGSREIYLTAKIPDNIIPSFTSIGVTRVDNGVPSAWSVYVKGISKITLSIVGAVGSNGSTIKSYSIVGGGFSSNKNVDTLGVFNTAGNITFTCTITDSRGRTASKTTTITVIDYSPPSLALKAERCNSSGAVSTTGQYVKISPVYYIASVSSKNAVASRNFQIVGTSYTNTTCVSGSSIVLGSNNIAQNQEYTIKGTVVDTLGNKAEITTSVGISAVPFNIRPSKNGMGLGRYCNKDGELQVGYDAVFDKSVSINGQNIINIMYPIGIVVEFGTNIDPNTLIGFKGTTWTRFAPGQVTIGYNAGDADFNSFGKTGGSKYIQNHKHDLWGGNTSTANNLADSSYERNGWIPNLGGHTWKNDTVADVIGVDTGNSGNLQPYVVVAKWIRTA